MSAAAWAAGSAVARPWRGRRRRWRRPGKEEEKRKERRRRRGAPASRPQQLVRLRYFQRQAEGAEVGSARPESLNWEEKEKEAGKMPLARAGRTAAPRPRCCNPRRLLFRPLGLHHANSRESEAHPLRPSGCGPRVPHVLDTFAAPDYTPRVRWGHQAHRGLSTGLVGCGRARRVASQRSGKKWASAPGCQGSADLVPESRNICFSSKEIFRPSQNITVLQAYTASRQPANIYRKYQGLQLCSKFSIKAKSIQTT
ncbi:PREDICTED: uncharacterized protein LOC109393720 isoform X3 [Hipposideros armiger]|uniref:Uncharacterized protein LOC109393720 isoform X3 n=1 Tax=Hipposideros armiger TaxID=186990 RepID=A0A8B7T3T1_HIPAR|nr:PREDICTED: uncharacterized protein LOC109393720 isoform X3 [Hipposideros armiger]XP_019518768.1 PREDICTED: uncharacterized protein LOC109393720 isoform X3 [Hipposideros armiger]